jgi:large subunit ribosomal protein L30
MLIHENASYQGMLQKVKDFVTWGEVNKKSVEKLLSARAGLQGSQLKETVDQLMKGEIRLKDITSLPLRLHPPIKGYEGVKRPYKLGGALGYRGKDINDLLGRML